MTTLRTGSLSDIGRVRSVNQDRAFAEGKLFAVADGMGGHAGGEVASSTAIDVLQSAFGIDPTEAGLSNAVRRANLAVWEQSRADDSLRGMGTTLIAAALVAGSGSDHLAIVNVGDSRAYLYHAEQLHQLTDDHSMVEEMVRSGELSAEEAAAHPQRHIVTRALGAQPVVDVDTRRVDPVAGDRVLLCSDGLVNEVGDGEITSVLQRRSDPQDAADELVRLARAHGGNDNITVVLVDVVDTGDGAAGEAASSIRRDALAGAAGGSIAEAGSGTVAEAASAHPGGTTSTGTTSTGATSTGAASTGAASGDPVSNRTATPPDRALDATGMVPRVGSTTVLEARRADPPSAGTTGLGSPPGAGDGQERSPRLPRRVTFRVVLFVAILLAVLIGAGIVVRWFANNSYYVGISGNQIAIFQGRPGGILWFKPHVSQSTDLTTASVLPSRIDDLRQGMQEPSLDAARRYVANLVEEARSLPSPAPATTPAATTPAATPTTTP